MRLGPVSLSYRRVAAVIVTAEANPNGVYVRAFHLGIGNRSWMVMLFPPFFSQTKNVAKSVRLAAESDPEIARIAGLDFPAHGVE